MSSWRNSNPFHSYIHKSILNVLYRKEQGQWKSLQKVYTVLSSSLECYRAIKMRTLLESLAAEVKKAAAHRTTYPPSQMWQTVKGLLYVRFFSFLPHTPNLPKVSAILSACMLGRGEIHALGVGNWQKVGFSLSSKFSLLSATLAWMPWRCWACVLQCAPCRAGQCRKGGGVCSANPNHFSLQLRYTHIKLPGCYTFCLSMMCSNYG